MPLVFALVSPAPYALFSRHERDKTLIVSRDEMMKIPTQLNVCMLAAILFLAACQTEPEPPSDRITQLRQRIGEIEQQCVPQKGASRQQVESIFGSGSPLLKAPSKIPPKAPPPEDSPRRAYRLCENGTLVVQYDSDWNVVNAHFPNPYSTKGRIGIRPGDSPALPDAELLCELESRLKQIEVILKAYKKRIED